MIDDTKKRKRSELSLGSEVLQGLFESGKHPLSEQFLRWKLWKKWPDYVGASIANVSEPVGYRRGTLYVWVKNSAWMQQLVFMLSPMKDSINAKLGIRFVKSIHLTMDRKSVPGSPEEIQELKDSIGKLMSEGEKPKE